MDDLAREVAGLRLRLRLQMVIVAGALVIGAFFAGGADVVARVLIEADAWKIRTNNAAGSPVDRLTVTAGVDNARLKLSATHLELAQQNPLPSGVAEGAVAYDQASHKLKYYNGTGWVESGGGGSIGGPVVETDSFRLVYANPTMLSLQGFGRNGGTINIDGTLCGFTTDLAAGPAPQPNTVFFAYASVTGVTVALEVSATAPTFNEYGRYATKTADASRRYLGMAYMNSSGQFTSDMVRSVKNEGGYTGVRQWATDYNPSISGNAWADIDAVNAVVTGLFFDNEKVTAWMTVTFSLDAPSLTTRYTEVSVWASGGAAPVTGSEVGGDHNRGTNFAAVEMPMHSKGYWTNSSAGVKTLRGRWRSISGGVGLILLRSAYAPLNIGFEVEH